MKSLLILFLKIALLLLGIAVIVILILFPLTEGRAQNLDIISIYIDPFILYGYICSIPFFIGLYKLFRLLSYIGQNKTFTHESVKALQSITRCAIVFSILILAAGLYIGIFHHKDDDPVGFTAVCAVAVLSSVAVGLTAAMFERKTRNGMSLQK